MANKHDCEFQWVAYQQKQHIITGETITVYSYFVPQTVTDLAKTGIKSLLELDGKVLSHKYCFQSEGENEQMFWLFLQKSKLMQCTMISRKNSAGETVNKLLD